MEVKTSFFSRIGSMARNLFWLLLIVMFVSQWSGAFTLERKRQGIIDAIQEGRGSRVITMIHREETVSFIGIPVSKYIDIDDAEAILRAIRMTPADRPIDIILHTPGVPERLGRVARRVGAGGISSRLRAKTPPR